MLSQIGVLLVIKHLYGLFMPKFAPPGGDNDSVSVELSSDFINPRTALLFGIPLLENVALGKLHFISVVGWLSFRPLFNVKRMRNFSIG